MMPKLNIRALLLIQLLLFISAHAYGLNESKELALKWTLSSPDTNIEITNCGAQTVYDLLLERNIIPDPYFGTNESSVQWVSTKDWVFTAKLPLGVFREGFSNELILGGINSTADIFLDDRLVGTSVNAFLPYSIALTRNASTIQLYFPKGDGGDAAAMLVTPQNLPGKKFVYSRKPAYQSGWDWGPTINDRGLTAPISIKSWRRLTVRFANVETIALEEQKAELRLTLEYSADASGFFLLRFLDSTYRRFLNKGVGRISLKASVNSPALWWSNGLGKPHLYKETLEIFEGEALITSIPLKYGIRTIELITEPDSIGSTFYFKLNGKRIFAAGANIIPPNAIQLSDQRADFRRIVEAANFANFNMLRVWGGGYYLPDYFYDLCDSTGILIWQDFMFACGMYPWEESFIQNVEREAAYQVKRLSSHPCLALWCGNNEISEGWARWGWKSAFSKAEQKEIERGYQQLFAEVLPMQQTDWSGTLSYWESSPLLGRGDENFRDMGDAHDWGVWHDEMPFERYWTHCPRFMSEFGYQAFPSTKSAILGDFNKEEEDWRSPIDASANLHNKHSRGFRLIGQLIEKTSEGPKGYEQAMYLSQIEQAAGIGLGAAAHRAQSRCDGSLIWQLNDCWPAFSWSAVDYSNKYKALIYELKRVFDEQWIQAFFLNEDVLVICFDLNNSREDIILEHKSLVGATLNKKRISIKDTKEDFVEVDISEFNFDGRDSYFSISRGETKALVFGQDNKKINLINRPINYSESWNKGISRIVIEADVVLKDLLLQTDLPENFSDNYFSLEKGDSKEIYINNPEKEPLGLRVYSINMFK